MDDLISRKEAFNAIQSLKRMIEIDEKRKWYNHALIDAQLAVLDSPPVKPDKVRCKDCANWKNGHVCLAWSRFGTIETKPNMWCCYWRLNDEN